jgi:UDP-sugar pyrophosphorylase
VPTGQSLDPGSEEFLKMEAAGLSAVSETGFILVAGGLGERLGYQGIKVSLPLYDAERDKCFLSLYIGHILDMQANHGNSRRIPLAIMTSDDTHALTERLLKDNNYFGMEPDQITIMKQNKVPALKDSDARFASSDGLIATKPHGHGDVHTLMHQTGLAKKWLDSGIKHIVFFQDTNGIIFRALPAVLGVSVTHQFAVNSVCVPRTPGEAVGGICKLTHTDGREVTVNVEYNQLDPLLKCSDEYPQGDVADASGHSPFPGNINILAMHLPTYTQTLQSTGGRVNEFVNPKYVDQSKTAFKSPTRLECMMQDFPLLLPKEAKVGFTTLPREVCFSPVKNNVKDAAGKQEKGLPIECAASAERDAYHLNGMLLRLAGAKVDVEENAEKMYAGIKIHFPPLITLLPSFATSLTQVKSHMRPGADVQVTARSALVLEGDVDIEGSLHVDGAVEIRAAPGAKIVVKSLKVANKGWSVTSVESSDDVLTAMRGFKVVKEETKIFEAVEGELVIEE